MCYLSLSNKIKSDSPCIASLAALLAVALLDVECLEQAIKVEDVFLHILGRGVPGAEGHPRLDAQTVVEHTIQLDLRATFA